MRKRGLEVTWIRLLRRFVASLDFLSKLSPAFFGNTGLSWYLQRKSTSESIEKRCHSWKGTCTSSSRGNGTLKGKGFTNVAAHHILNPYGCGSSRASTLLATAIVLGNDIPFLMSMVFSVTTAARKCSGSGTARTFGIQSCLMCARIKSTSQNDGAHWSSPSYTEKPFVLM